MPARTAILEGRAKNVRTRASARSGRHWHLGLPLRIVTRRIDPCGVADTRRRMCATRRSVRGCGRHHPDGGRHLFSGQQPKCRCFLIDRVAIAPEKGFCHTRNRRVGYPDVRRFVLIVCRFNVVEDLGFAFGERWLQGSGVACGGGTKAEYRPRGWWLSSKTIGSPISSNHEGMQRGGVLGDRALFLGHCSEFTNDIQVDAIGRKYAIAATWRIRVSCPLSRAMHFVRIIPY